MHSHTGCQLGLGCALGWGPSELPRWESLLHLHPSPTHLSTFFPSPFPLSQYLTSHTAALSVHQLSEPRCQPCVKLVPDSGLCCLLRPLRSDFPPPCCSSHLGLDPPSFYPRVKIESMGSTPTCCRDPGTLVTGCQMNNPTTRRLTGIVCWTKKKLLNYATSEMCLLGFGWTLLSTLPLSIENTCRAIVTPL